ncbi:multicopper oxidase family protein [Paenibacillus sp. CF384]|uniref:multicopper oxidase family protein n=1 Tax=Paenibacillus sp. CF384 TaxID=1884382 RepID=UPI00089C5804|nr:multicopper oxidase family protein [Paenibacillus sp. CF384]SDX82568.1 Multicopper oxidase with three cupredoxin domains (includes cell division protein FtsP and spore coat protein CotA) [Paenibacillus sp. CF384]
MYALLYGLDALTTIVLVVFGWMAGGKAGRLVYSASYKKLKHKSRTVMILFSLSLLALAGKMIIAQQLYTQFGWLFSQDRILLQLPPLLLAGMASGVYGIPRLIRVMRLQAENQDMPLDAAAYRLAGDSALIIPFKGMKYTAIASLLFYFVPVVPIRWLDAAAVLLILLVFITIMAYRVLSRSKSIHQHENWMPLGRKLRAAKGVVEILIVVLLAFGVWMYEAKASRLPETMSMMTGTADFGGGIVSASAHQHAAHAVTTGEGSVSVETLTGPREGEPDRRFTLTAEKKLVRSRSGQMVEAWTYNGQIPGPELRMRQGELIEVTLINNNIDAGVTLHWHGLDVPNAEDGVAGATQNAVMPGQTHTYRFIAEQTGTFWYHSHQDSAEAVKKGLFGALVVEDPADPATNYGIDRTIMTYSLKNSGFSFGAGADAKMLEQVQAEPGTPVRLRLINTENWVQRAFTIVGVPFQVAAIDGTELNGPTDLSSNTRLEVTTGGRYDVTFIMPKTPVFINIGNHEEGILFSMEGNGEPLDLPKSSTIFDPSTYGTQEVLPFSLDSHYDREFLMVLDNQFTFYNGGFGALYTINGELFPNTPMYMVKEGDLVKTTIVNRGMVEHPMHLHGHHMLVLSRNGKSVSGSPWWSDTLYVGPGERYEVAFLADNPGIWMDHCHNLDHAKVGMSMHLAYEGITTPFALGTESHNHPE